MQKLTLKNNELPYEVEEELKSLRTNLQLCGDDKRVILVTSCFANEGKSTTARELARSLTALGKNVLLIDSDLRKSVVKEQVESGTIGMGLTHYLIRRCPAADAIYSTNISGLYLMPAGALPPNPSELLSSQRMAELLDRARETYDYVLVDSAPLGMVTDAAIVAQHCDGAVLLIEAGTVQRRLAQEVLQKLQNTQCPVLGVVLNKVDRRQDKYYSYGRYEKYYGSSKD